MPSGWKRARYRLEWVGLYLAAKMVPLLSRLACFYLAQFLGAVISVLDRHGRKVALNNLEVAFGTQLSEGERQRIVRQSFQHFARTMLDLLWSPRLNGENVSRHVEFENFEEIARVTGPERTFIMACYHYSNFEWVGIAGGYVGIVGTVLSQEFKNDLLGPIFKAIRERPGHEFVPREGGLIRIYKALRRKRTTAILVDLTIPPRGQGVVAIDCFGLKTSVTSAHAWLHERTGVPIIPVHCEPLPKGRYRVVFHPYISSSGMSHQQIAQACWDSFEPYLRKHPAPWLWMYKHWRYRPVNADRPYPFYAHIFERFDKLLAEQTGAR